ncbi:hypothetical protein RSOL_006320, partial [Rhizoctonia solani AG-3 Rhs1AP]
MLLAPPERLGFDPDVVLLPCDNPNAEPPNYDITIHNPDTKESTTYRTLKLISDVRADSMVGPGTRVWIVRKLVDGDLEGPCYVLKDTWMHEDCDAEHELLMEIRGAQPEYSQYFLTPLNYGFATSNGTTPDNTHKTLRQVELVPTNNFLATRQADPTGGETRPTTARNGTGHAGDVSTVRQKGYRDFRRLSEHALQHYRIVVEEIGRPVHDLRDWTEIFTAIQGGWEGLHAINLCGYVHRDGTAAFMATEVASNEHHRLLDLRCWQAKLDAHQNQSSLRLKDKYQWKLPPFRHNPLHDMESVWWLCVWMMFRLVPAGQDADEQSNSYHQVFDHKQEFICNLLEFSRKTAHLREIAGLISIMETWSTALNDHFHSSYKAHDDSKTLSGIRVGSKRTVSAYDDGSRCLKELNAACQKLSATEFVWLTERSDVRAEPTKVKNRRGKSSARATKRRQASARRAAQAPKLKGTQPRTPGVSAGSVKSQGDKPARATTSRAKVKLTVYVELPAPKKARYVIFYFAN